MSTPTEEEAVKYMLQIYGNVTREQVEAMSAEEQKQLYAEWGELNRTPGLTPGVEMDDPATATTVRVDGGQTLTTDGPFVETKEALGGYFLIEADDLDAALEVAAKVPTARRGGAVEVRPVVER
ncbi:MAG TPA: YciI family protein [Thermoleophilaceae bacterium]|nr:YciI family protein [Thermoleophilaceae bacterium]